MAAAHKSVNAGGRRRLGDDSSGDARSPQPNKMAASERKAMDVCVEGGRGLSAIRGRERERERETINFRWNWRDESSAQQVMLTLEDEEGGGRVRAI